MNNLKMYNMEAMQFLQGLESESVDAVLTDPPYCNGGIKGSSRRRPTSEKTQQTGTVGKKPDFVGDTRDQRSFERWLRLWMTECWRVCRDGAYMMCFMDWRNLACVIDSLQVAGFTYCGLFCWVKPNGRPQRNAFKNDVEFVVWGTKGRPKPGPEGDRYSPGYILQQPMATSKRIHGTEKPVEVLERLLTFVPEGGLVVDPFAGSGAVGEACHDLGLDFKGCELVEEYARIATERLEAL